MKKIILILILCIFSCGDKESLIGEYYTSEINNTKTYITFINDTTIVLAGNENFEHCSTNYFNTKKSKNKYPVTNGVSLDTLFLYKKDNDLIYEIDDTKYFYKAYIPKNNQLSKSIAFHNKNIVFKCGIDVKKINYYFEKSKENLTTILKNPTSLTVQSAYITDFKQEYGSKKEVIDTISVKLETKVKNGIGLEVESEDEILFTPTKNKKGYDVFHKRELANKYFELAELKAEEGNNQYALKLLGYAQYNAFEYDQDYLLDRIRRLKSQIKISKL